MVLMVFKMVKQYFFVAKLQHYWCFVNTFGEKNSIRAKITIQNHQAPLLRAYEC
jgi:hypothetical protein